MLYAELAQNDSVGDIYLTFPAIHKHDTWTTALPQKWIGPNTSYFVANTISHLKSSFQTLSDKYHHLWQALHLSECAQLYHDLTCSEILSSSNRTRENLGDVASNPGGCWADACKYVSQTRLDLWNGQNTRHDNFLTISWEVFKSKYCCHDWPELQGD